MSLDAFSYISRFISLSESETKLFQENLQVMTCFPRQVLTQVGDLEQHIYFVQRGLVRKFFYQNNEEVTVQLATEGDLASSSVSFLSGVLSEFVVETLEPTTLAFITKSALESLFAYSHNFEKMGRLITLAWLLEKERWDIMKIVKSPRERFLVLMQEKPELLKRAPQKYIASFLDMKPETFSRFKKKVMEDLENE